ncbi:MAG: 2-dehydropantoate 2-reductase [Deltaproteobacteria bacterium]|nr:2-dehydropantoate 2-reductase [Deltaproteobacteria bacterium]
MERIVFRVAVMGAGAVGGYFGARLAASGQEVAFVARGRHLEAMKGHGLRVKSIQGDLHNRSQFTSDPEEVGPVDLIVFCVKSHDTEEASRRMAPLVGEKTSILSLQNGVDNPDKIAAHWGKERVLAGAAYIGAQITAPGTIEHRAAGRITLGELDGGITQETKALCDLFNKAQVPCTVSPEIRKVLWGKLVWNAPFCALASVAGATVEDIVESESLTNLAVGCMEEVMEAARTQGIDLGHSIVSETLNLSHSLGDFKPSMLQDLEAGKPLEYEALNGIVVKTLRKAGKEAPFNQTFHALLQSLDKTRRTQKSPAR